MSVGVDPFRCRRCGESRVVYYIKLSKRNAILKVACPKCRRKKPLTLPLNTRDQWIGKCVEQIYRCTLCGQQIQDPARIIRTGRWIVLHMECPQHGLKDSKRHILDTLYPVIQNLHQNPTAPPTFNITRPPPPPPGAGYPPPPPPG
ncbi:MAG: hypothetical protein ACFFD2_12615, partial [Promethearchaeota archaeon]